jgi:hypothetical protein
MNRHRLLLSLALSALHAACVTAGGASRPLEVSLPAVTPIALVGTPMHSPELARDTAELALALLGIDCQERRARISFLEGVYTIAFLAPSTAQTIERFEVDILQEDSSVVAVRRIQPRRHAAE